MIVASDTYKDKYPFTPASTMSVGRGLNIPKGAILDCLFYPSTPELYAYVYVSRIYNDGGNGILEISGDRGSVLGRFVVPLKAAAELEGFAEDNYGNVCGSILCDTSCIPLFYGSYKLTADSLVLMPECFRPILTEPLLIGSLKYNNKEITSVDPDGVTTVDSDAGIAINIPQPDVVEPARVTELIVNGVSLTGKHISIMCNHGGGRVVSAGDTITIGERSAL